MPMSSLPLSKSELSVSWFLKVLNDTKLILNDQDGPQTHLQSSWYNPEPSEHEGQMHDTEMACRSRLRITLQTQISSNNQSISDCNKEEIH